MKTEQLITVVVRIFAVSLLLIAARSGLWLTLTSSEDAAFRQELMTWSSLVFVPVAVAAMFWRYPMVLAKRGANALPDREAMPQLNLLELQVAGVSLLGLWLLTSALPELARWIGFMLVSPPTGATLMMSNDQKAEFIGSIVQLVIAVVMVLGPRGIIGMLRRFRAAGS